MTKKRRVFGGRKVKISCRGSKCGRAGVAWSILMTAPALVAEISRSIWGAGALAPPNLRSIRAGGAAESGGLAIVVSQDSTQPLVADDLAFRCAHRLRWLDQLIAQPLMIPFSVVMFEVRLYGGAQRVLAKEDHPF
jgi:hypothetical protein